MYVPELTNRPAANSVWTTQHSWTFCNDSSQQFSRSLSRVCQRVSSRHIMQWFKNHVIWFLLGNSRRLNFICQRFGTFSLFNFHRRLGTKNVYMFTNWKWIHIWYYTEVSHVFLLTPEAYTIKLERKIFQSFVLMSRFSHYDGISIVEIQGDYWIT